MVDVLSVIKAVRLVMETRKIIVSSVNQIWLCFISRTNKENPFVWIHVRMDTRKLIVFVKSVIPHVKLVMELVKQIACSVRQI